MTQEEKLRRFIYVKQELEKSMASVINSIGLGFMPANYKMLESMAQEYWQLKNELSL